MDELPSKTAVNRYIPKEAFYRHVRVGSAVRQLFVDQIDRITLTNIVDNERMNVLPGEWAEIDVLEVRLKEGAHGLAPEALDILGELANPSIVCELIPGDEYRRYSISYKVHTYGGNPKTERMLTSPWTTKHLDFSGVSIDAIYASLIKQISGLSADNNSTTAKLSSVDEVIIRHDEAEAAKKQIKRLKKQYSKESSTVKRNEIARRIHELKNKL